MRTLASLGILIEDATRRFDLTPVGEFLAYKLSAGINDDRFPAFKPPQSNRVTLGANGRKEGRLTEP